MAKQMYIISKSIASKYKSKADTYETESQHKQRIPDLLLSSGIVRKGVNRYWFCCSGIQSFSSTTFKSRGVLLNAVFCDLQSFF